MRLELLSTESQEPVTVEELSLHLRLNQTDEDTRLASLITAARSWAEKYSGRALITQTWRMRVEGHEGGEVVLTPSPIVSVVDSVLGSLDVTAPLSKWPTVELEAGDYTLEYIAGFGGDLDSPQHRIPEPFRQAILLYAEALYDKDERTMGMIIDAAKALLDQNGAVRNMA